MGETLDYAGPGPQRRSLTLALLANGMLMYPVVLAGLVYGEWLLAWFCLGHEPRSSLDDPKYINGSSWMHPITGIALLGAIPAAIAGLAFNGIYVGLLRVRPKRIAVRFAVLVLFWLAIFILMSLDPRGVLYWWFD
ncbi:MAG TPA: hypothetical protein VGQ99_23570 [Tepidisphaeraceae bacterium]|jgi:hypothetical protein|nr:hypothetical protein [Tepidisphaeraceae bacterium]